MNDQNKRLSVPVKMLLIVAVYVIFYALTSCGAKKKTVEKSEYTTEIATVERVNELTEKSVQTDVTFSESNKIESKHSQENFEGEVADSTKPATVTTEEKDGMKKTTYTNFKNVKTGAVNSESQTSKDLGQNLSKTDLSKTDLTQKQQTKEKTATNTTNKNLNVQRGFPWHWIIIVLFLYAVISYFRKTINPLKWF